MVVACPKCKSRLRIPDEKIKPEGTRIKCPKCTMALLIKKGPQTPPSFEKPSIPVKEPVAPPVKKPSIPVKGPVAPLLVAHAEAGVLDRLKAVFAGRGFEVLSATDGKTALIKVIKGGPSIAFLDVALPVVSGYQLSLYMKKKMEGIRTFLIVSSADETRRRKGPASAYGAVDYVEGGAAGSFNEDTLLSLLEKPSMLVREPIVPVAPPPPPKVEKPSIPIKEPVAPSGVERARRLVRVVLSDLGLYSPKKVEDAIRAGNFKEAFAKDLKEGIKHYENRIPADVRSQGDFFGEELGNFIEKKRKALGL